MYKFSKNLTFFRSTRPLTIVVALVLCLGLAVSPLMQSLSLFEKVEAFDELDDLSINYNSDEEQLELEFEPGKNPDIKDFTVYFNDDAGYSLEETDVNSTDAISSTWSTASMNDNGQILLGALNSINNEGGLYLYDNEEWTLQELNDDGGKIISLGATSINGNGEVRVAGLYGGELYIYTEQSGSWIIPNGFDYLTHWFTSSISQTGEVIVAGAYNGRLHLSTNQGVDWSEIQPAGDENKVWTISSMNDDGNIIIVGDGAQNKPGRLYLSTNQGVDWNEIQPAENRDFSWRTGKISGDGQTIVVGVASYNDQEYHDGRLYLSTNQGGDWSEVQPAGDVSRNWYTLAISKDGRKILVGDSGGVDKGRLYLSTDQGITWKEMQPAGDRGVAWRASAMSPSGHKILVGIASSDKKQPFLSTDRIIEEDDKFIIPLKNPLPNTVSISYKLNGNRKYIYLEKTEEDNIDYTVFNPNDSFSVNKSNLFIDPDTEEFQGETIELRSLNNPSHFDLINMATVDSTSFNSSSWKLDIDEFDDFESNQLDDGKFTINFYLNTGELIHVEQNLKELDQDIIEDDNDDEDEDEDEEDDGEDGDEDEDEEDSEDEDIKSQDKPKKQSNSGGGGGSVRSPSSNELDSAHTSAPETLVAEQSCTQYFADTLSSNPLCNQMAYLQEQGIFLGQERLNRRDADLESFMNRAEAFTIIARIQNTTFQSIDFRFLFSFEDITFEMLYYPHNYWWMTAVSSLKGIIRGNGDQTLKPADTMNLAELAKITVESIVPDFKNNDNQYPWYTDTLNFYESIDYSFDPIQLATREDAVKMVYRTLMYIHELSLDTNSD